MSGGRVHIQNLLEKSGLPSKSGATARRGLWPRFIDLGEEDFMSFVLILWPHSLSHPRSYQEVEACCGSDAAESH